VGNEVQARERFRCRGDGGSGLFSLMASFTVFMLLLLFAAHVLIGLYARSMAAGAAFDGAHYLAQHGGDGEVGARTTVENLLGASLIDARPTYRDDEYVEYTVVVQAPSFLSQRWLPGWSNTIERTARARLERPR
jgi:hypothetical protein